MSSATESTEQAQADAPQFHVRCARELFEALESSDGVIRVAALQAVQNDPATALGFGLHGNRDLVDVLLSQAELLRETMEWLDWIGALAGYRDPRVFRLFASLITTQSHTELLFALANYLTGEPLDPIRAQLGAALMQNDCVARARAVASLLAGDPRLSAAETLRIGLLQPDAGTPLPVFSENTGDWLTELGGPFQLEARLELQRQGESTAAALVRNWDRLPESGKKWLLEWATETEPALVVDGLKAALTERSDALIVPALEAAAKLCQNPADLGSLILPLLEHEDELVRRAAVRAYRSPHDWQQFLHQEPSALVREACIARIIDQEGQQAIPFALQLLADPDWRIRAAAADGLLSLGESGMRAALTLLPEASESTRIAIARMVIQSDDEALVEEFVRCCPQAVDAQSAV